MIKDFASFHNHSHFSIMDGISLPDEMIKTAKEKGLKAIAITDHGHCHAHADFYLAGKKHGVRTVFGVEAYVINDLDQWAADKDSDEEDAPEIDTNSRVTTKKVSKYRKGHLVLLAANQEGLSNLYQLTYLSHRDGFYSKPRMDKKMLAAHSKGVIATSACMGGVLSLKCWDLKDGRGTFEDVVKEAKEFDNIFGRGRFFIELQFNESEGQRFINDILVRVHKETGIPLTVTADAHYTQPDEWKAQELLYMLRGKKTVATRGDNWSFEVKQLYIKSAEEMWKTFEKFGGTLEPKVAIEAFQNTLLIDSLIENFEPDTHKRLPSLPYEDSFQEMMQRAIAGLKAHGLAKRDEYKARLLHELKIIQSKGFANYFLTMEKIIKEAKKTMLVGEGRGSSGASLVCYCLGITDIDPIEHDLLFERFMDPNRTEEPDIDTDFEDVEATKDMLRRMFGQDNVACLSAYGTFQIKGLLKDLGRVYDVDNRIINSANKQIEKELKVLYINQDKSTLVVKLDDIKRVSPTFNQLISDYPQLGEHITKLYGRNRHIGRHASGVIIGDNLPAETALFVAKNKPLSDNPEDEPDDDDEVSERRIVQASFTEGIINKNVSAMGFTKFDILSLATLKVIHYALKLISQRTGRPIEELREMIRSKNMNLNDPKIMKHVFWDGNFAGVFQFTEKGIRRVAKSVKPDTFVDVSAIASIYRPGPLAGGFDKLYAYNKHNPENVSYDHPLLEGILKKSRGCIVFQEQLMQICNQLGKMSWKDVNSVRKVLLKKDKSKTEEFLKSENDRLSALFFRGCAENGFEGASELLDMIANGVTPEFWETDGGPQTIDPQNCCACGKKIDGVGQKIKGKGWAHTRCANPSNKTLKLWKDLLAFGGYGFNKAHSDAYSVMTMQCAYLATYYPMEWYAAVLTKGKSGDLQQYVGDIQRAQIKILPVDVNASRGAHVIEGNTIRLAFSSVKGVGPAAIQKIVAAQPYTDFIDFLDRSGASKTNVVPLIRAGAFQSICDKPMAELEHKYMEYSDNPKLKTKKGRHEFMELWDARWTADSVSVFMLNDKAKKKDRKPRTLQLEAGDYSLADKVGFELSLFGFSLRGSPWEILGREEKIAVNLERMMLEQSKKGYDYFYGISYDDAVQSSSDVVVLPVIVKRVFEKPQRNGQMMAFLTFETMEGKEFDCPAFSSIWKHIRAETRKGSVYIGTFNRKFGEDAGNLLVGRPGFGHSESSAKSYMMDVDKLPGGESDAQKATGS